MCARLEVPEVATPWSVARAVSCLHELARVPVACEPGRRPNRRPKQAGPRRATCPGVHRRPTGAGGRPPLGPTTCPRQNGEAEDLRCGPSPGGSSSSALCGPRPPRLVGRCAARLVGDPYVPARVGEFIMRVSLGVRRRRPRGGGPREHAPVCAPPSRPLTSRPDLCHAPPADAISVRGAPPRPGERAPGRAWDASAIHAGPRTCPDAHGPPGPGTAADLGRRRGCASAARSRRVQSWQTSQWGSTVVNSTGNRHAGGIALRTPLALDAGSHGLRRHRFFPGPARAATTPFLCRPALILPAAAAWGRVASAWPRSGFRTARRPVPKLRFVHQHRQPQRLAGPGPVAEIRGWPILPFPP